MPPYFSNSICVETPSLSQINGQHYMAVGTNSHFVTAYELSPSQLLVNHISSALLSLRYIIYFFLISVGCY